MALGCSLSQVTAAMDYALDSALRYDASHDNNLQLSERRNSSFGQTASGRANLSATSERTEASVDAQLWARRYNRSGFDSDDQTVKTHFAHTAERARFALDFSAARDSTLTSELLDSGRLQSAERHEQYSASPSASYQLGETDLITLQGSYLVSQYSGGSYTDYDYWQTQGLWTHSLSERLRAFVSLSYSDYQSQPLQYPFEQSYASATTERGIQIGGDYQLNENFSISLLAGASRSDNDVQVQDPQQYCPLFAGTFLAGLFPLCALRDTETSLTTYRGSLSWSNERNQLSIDIARSTEPSSNGYVQQSDQLDLAWRYRLWEYGTLGLDTTYGQSDAPDARSARSSEPSRDYLYSTLSYTHALSDAWSIDCNYRYRTQKYETLDRVESNVAFIGITWKPQSQHWSR